MLVNFQPCQIVCLECQDDRLYGELIQFIEERQIGWVRPLVLVHTPGADPHPDSCFPDEGSEFPTVYDLRQGADLLWPIALFRAALDTEIFPVLAQLWTVEPKLNIDRTARQYLHHFMQQVWQAHSEVFQA